MGEFYRGTFLAPDCANCPLRTSVKVPPEGDLEAHVMIVGEAPGEEEEITGRPFQGRSGQLLNQLLERLDVDRSALWISNSALCHPRSMSRLEATTCLMCKPKKQKKSLMAIEAGPCSWCDGSRVVQTSVYLNDKQVLHEAVVRCRERLFSEVKKIQPRVVVPLGRYALEAFIGKSSGIIAHRGGIHIANVALEQARA